MFQVYISYIFANFHKPTRQLELGVFFAEAAKTDIPGNVLYQHQLLPQSTTVILEYGLEQEKRNSASVMVVQHSIK